MNSRPPAPKAWSLFAEPELLVAYRESLARQGKGPHLSMGALADYIASEQKLGRIDSHVDTKLGALNINKNRFKIETSAWAHAYPRVD